MNRNSQIRVVLYVIGKVAGGDVTVVGVGLDNAGHGQLVGLTAVIIEIDGQICGATVVKSLGNDCQAPEVYGCR